MKRKVKRVRKRLDRSTRLSEAEDAFLAHAAKVAEGYFDRKQKDVDLRDENARRELAGEPRLPHAQLSPPFNQAEGFLKRESYALIREHIAKNRGKAIRSIVRRFVGEPRYPSYKDNPFYWGFLAIESGHTQLGAKRISKYAQQLLYAHKNGVPPQFLVGFLYQIRGSVDLDQLITEMKRGSHRDPSLNMQIPLAGPPTGA